ncbi:yersiniabactin synthetase, thiazolinyl reductase component, partial [Pseudomonas syringae pv. actinidiae ICMP 19096]
TSNADYLQHATAMPLHPAASHWRSAHEIEGPAGVAWLLWQDILRCAGPAEQRMASAPPFIDAALLRTEG